MGVDRVRVFDSVEKSHIGIIRGFVMDSGKESVGGCQVDEARTKRVDFNEESAVLRIGGYLDFVLSVVDGVRSMYDSVNTIADTGETFTSGASGYFGVIMRHMVASCYTPHCNYSEFVFLLDGLSDNV